MCRMMLAMVVATFAFSSAVYAQGAGGLQGTGGLPEHNVPGTDLPLYTPSYAEMAGSILKRMRDAAAKCDRAAYDAAVAEWNALIKDLRGRVDLYRNGAKWNPDAKEAAKQSLAVNRGIADANALKRFQADSPDFPQFPVEKCKKAVVDPPPPPPPPPKPPTPPEGPHYPVGKLTVTHRQTTCAPCQHIVALFNQAAEEYVAAHNDGAIEEPLLKVKMDDYARALDACEKQCTQPPWVPGVTRPPSPPPPPRDVRPGAAPSRPSVPTNRPGGTQTPERGAAFTRRQAACSSCQSTAVLHNQAVDEHAEALRTNSSTEPFLKLKIGNLARALDACEQRCVPHAAPPLPRVGPGPTNQPGGGPNNMR